MTTIYEDTERVIFKNTEVRGKTRGKRKRKKESEIRLMKKGEENMEVVQIIYKVTKGKPVELQEGMLCKIRLKTKRKKQEKELEYAGVCYVIEGRGDELRVYLGGIGEYTLRKSQSDLKVLGCRLSPDIIRLFEEYASMQRTEKERGNKRQLKVMECELDRQLGYLTEREYRETLEEAWGIDKWGSTDLDYTEYNFKMVYNERGERLGYVITVHQERRIKRKGREKVGPKERAYLIESLKQQGEIHCSTTKPNKYRIEEYKSIGTSADICLFHGYKIQVEGEIELSAQNAKRVAQEVKIKKEKEREKEIQVEDYLERLLKKQNIDKKKLEAKGIEVAITNLGRLRFSKVEIIEPWVEKGVYAFIGGEGLDPWKFDDDFVEDEDEFYVDTENEEYAKLLEKYKKKSFAELKVEVKGGLTLEETHELELSDNHCLAYIRSIDVTIPEGQAERTETGVQKVSNQLRVQVS